jgi:hypothetical protein
MADATNTAASAAATAAAVVMLVWPLERALANPTASTAEPAPKIRSTVGRALLDVQVK